MLFPCMGFLGKRFTNVMEDKICLSFLFLSLFCDNNIIVVAILLKDFIGRLVSPFVPEVSLLVIQPIVQSCNHCFTTLH